MKLGTDLTTYAWVAATCCLMAMLPTLTADILTCHHMKSAGERNFVMHNNAQYPDARTISTKLISVFFQIVKGWWDLGGYGPQFVKRPALR